ncbi:hypothetical protein WCD74_27185 [Actinomycetospora sp. OC33-EN08]|uniref:Uncharacterized protein n=1 Tax=Actinomycetospora aurantiaca TaxID=3129233 RepID=A0ABU8MVY7_9PSEU
MSSPSLARRADTSPTDAHTHPEILVLSVHPDECGADAAEHWARRVPGARPALSSDATLDEQLGTAQQVLVLDPGALAARRGFGARATSQERLQLIARLAGRRAQVTWARTAAQATRWAETLQA